MKVERMKLDTTHPTRELLQEAYRLALEVWNDAPWERMDERQVLAVRFADGREGFLSVMGEMGTHRAIALYSSFADYVRVRSIDDSDVYDVEDAFFSTHQLQLAFEGAANMNKGEMADIRASGIKFKRGMNPSFVSYVPGFAPDRMGAGELTRFLDFIRAFMAFCEQHGSDAIATNDAPMKLVTTWREDASGIWTKGDDDFSPLLPVAVSLDESLIEKVAALPVSENTMCMEVGAFAVPVGRTPEGRGKMSRCVMIVEGATQFTMGVNIFETPDDRETDWTPVVEFALKTMIQFEKRPTHLAAFGTSLRGILQGLTKTRFKGTEFMPYNPCDAAHEAFAFVSDRMF